MSTKIYDAYIIEKHYDAVRFLNKVQDYSFVNQLIEKNKTKYLNYFKFLVLNEFDSSVMAGFNDSFHDVFRAVLLKQGKLKELSLLNKRSDLGVFRFEFSFKFFEGSLLVKFFGDNQLIKEFVEMFPELKDFSYWNNTDKPDEISLKEWDRREKIWDDVLGFKSWTESGFALYNPLNGMGFINSFLDCEIFEHCVSEILNNKKERTTYQIKDAKVNFLEKKAREAGVSEIPSKYIKFFDEYDFSSEEYLSFIKMVENQIEEHYNWLESFVKEKNWEYNNVC